MSYILEIKFYTPLLFFLFTFVTWGFWMKIFLAEYEYDEIEMKKTFVSYRKKCVPLHRLSVEAVLVHPSKPPERER